MLFLEKQKQQLFMDEESTTYPLAIASPLYLRVCITKYSEELVSVRTKPISGSRSRVQLQIGSRFTYPSRSLKQLARQSTVDH